MKYIAFYTLNYGGNTMTGNSDATGNLNSMVAVRKLEQSIIDQLVTDGILPATSIPIKARNYIAITGWKEFPDEVPPEAEKEGIYKEGTETRYYMKDSTYVLRFNERADGDKYPVWVYEGKR